MHRKQWISAEQRLGAPVAAVLCSTYDRQEVQTAMEQLIELLGGLTWVKPGMRVAIKVNLVSGMHPDEAATTHPVLIQELSRLLIQKGAAVIVGDSPGGLYNDIFVGNVYKKSGYLEREMEGAVLNRDYSIQDTMFEKAVSIRSFSYTAWLDRADAIINVCKFKTHAMMAMSCAVKNLFGTIPGTTKPEYHMRFPDSAAFANLMVDLNEYFTPVWNIVDAVYGMEGNGPTAGTPRHVGRLLASADPYGLDMACAWLMGLAREDVPTLQEAYRRKLGPENIDKVERIGDETAWKQVGFELVTRRMSTTFARSGPFGGVISRLGLWALRTRPNVQVKDCIGCRKCEQVCPAKAIAMVRKKPLIDRDKCIRCFCCQEFCPKGAMRVQHTWIGALLSRINSGFHT